LKLATDKRGVDLAQRKENPKYHKDKKSRTTKEKVGTTRFPQINTG
jgi:hypothetical protein